MTIAVVKIKRKEKNLAPFRDAFIYQEDHSKQGRNRAEQLQKISQAAVDGCKLAERRCKAEYARSRLCLYFAHSASAAARSRATPRPTTPSKTIAFTCNNFCRLPYKVCLNYKTNYERITKVGYLFQILYLDSHDKIRARA